MATHIAWPHNIGSYVNILWMYNVNIATLVFYFCTHARQCFIVCSKYNLSQQADSGVEQGNYSQGRIQGGGGGGGGGFGG